ncbi:MAG: uroporphyrinogen decarboxylase family protein [Bacillota bacterium]|nr:uroporphyrinogen decarboxylase family protein [Bacillota bacterium]
MYINMDEWSQEIIDAKDRRVVPVLYFPCLSLTGMGIIETVNDGKKMAQTMKAIIDKYPATIASVTGMDLTVDAEAFGSTVTFKDNEAPSIRTELIKTPEDVQNLKVPDVHSGRVDVFIDAVKEAQNLITDRPVMGGQLGPFSLAANLMEVQAALKCVRKDPDTMKVLLDKATDFLIARARAYKEAGANGIFLAEPTAGLLSPKQIEEFSSVYVRKMVDAVQDSGFYIILHNCGYVTKSVSSMYGTGCKGYHFGNSVDMKDILPQIPANVLVFGNVDPSSVFTNGTPEKMHEVSMQLLEEMKDYPHYVFSSGCDIPPLAPLENVDAFYAAIEEYNSKL